MFNCRICAGQLDSGVACAPCAGQLAADLKSVWGSGDLHGLDTDLDMAIGKQTVFTTDKGGKQPKKSEVPLPINLAASEARQVLHSTLATWCRVLLDEQDGPHPKDTLASMARWMHLRTEQVRHAEWGEECIDEVRAAIREARRAVDRPGERELVGRCDCGAALYVRPGASQVVCRMCPEQELHEVEERRDRMAKEAAGFTANATMLATLMKALGTPVSASTIRGWAMTVDGRPPLITSVGTDGRGNPMYSLEQVKAAHGRAKERKMAS